MAKAMYQSSLRRRRSTDDRGGGVWDEIARVVTEAANRGLIAAIVFGSLARGDRSADSDIDVILVVEAQVDIGPVRRRLQMAAAGTSIHRTISLIFFTGHGLIEEALTRPSFAAHLRDEGVVVFESPAFADVEFGLGAAWALDGRAMENELVERTKVLERLSHLERFNGEFVPTLAQLYALARSVVIVKLLQQGISEYRWRRMFDVLSQLRPDLKSDLIRLRDLRPYYEHMRGRSELSEADQQVDHTYVEAAIDAVRAIADISDLANVRSHPGS